MKRIILDDAFAPTPAAFSSRVDSTLRSINQMSEIKKRTRVRVTLVAAIILVLALTGAAFATGVIQSIFRSMTVPNEEATVDFTALDELAQENVYSETVNLDNASQPLNIEVLQSYYDGEQIMLGVNFTSPRMPADLAFGPDSPKFGELMGAKGTLRTLKAYLTQEEYAAFEKTYKETGRAGVTYYNFALSDGFNMEDGTSIGFKANADDAAYPGVGVGYYYASDSPLPDKARNLDEIDVTLYAYQTPVSRYIDQHGEYVFYGDRATYPASFTVKRTAKAEQRRHANVKFGSYKARATLGVTPVDTHVTIKLSKASRWDDSFDGQDGCIYNYQLLADGVLLNGELTDYLDDDTRSGTWAPIPEGTKSVTLRPVYSRFDENGRYAARPNPKQDIVFDMTLPPDAQAAPALDEFSQTQVEQPNETLPVPEAELIDRARQSLVDMGFFDPNAPKDIQWDARLGFDLSHSQAIPLVSGKYRDESVQAGVVAPIYYYTIWFEPDTLVPYSIKARALGPGHTNGSLTFGDYDNPTDYERWDDIAAQEKWELLAQSWLDSRVTTKGQQLKLIKSQIVMASYYGYETISICVSFKSATGEVHDVTIDPDTEQVVEYERTAANTPLR